MSRADYDDPLYRESIPQRITPTPDNGDGPTACMMRAERQRLLWQLASDNATDDPSRSSVVSA